MTNDESTWGRLESLRTSLAEKTVVESTTMPSGDWGFADGALRHRSVEFFSVVGYVDDQNVERILLRQNEIALIGLLTARIEGQRHFLLNARCEPGLHGLCQYSTTIQSTPSNYLRRHGGDATPFLDFFLGEGEGEGEGSTNGERAGARVVHDSLEYDWGEYYAAKRKRFLILEVDELLPAESPLIWVPESVVLKLVSTDFLVASDLRAAITVLLAHDRPETHAPRQISEGTDVADAPRLTPTKIENLRNWTVDEWGIREIEPRQRVSIEYVKATSASREVRTWNQPLMRISDDKVIRLWTRELDGVRQIGLTSRTQPGLGSVALCFPADGDVDGEPLLRVRTSAEGGRFIDHEISMQLGRLSIAQSAELVATTWVSDDELAALLLVADSTAVELRLVASLLSVVSATGS